VLEQEEESSCSRLLAAAAERVWDIFVQNKREVSFKKVNGHPYWAGSNQSPKDGFSIVFTSSKRPAPFKRPLSIFPRVAV